MTLFILYLYYLTRKEVLKMARGAPRQFPYTLEETQEKFELYKQKVADNEVLFPCWQDFCVFIDVDTDMADEVMLDPVGTNKELSEYLKKSLKWCFNQLFTNPNWLKKPVAAIYLSKQKFGGYCYTDKQEVKQDTKMDINVSFGGKKKVNNAFD
jgi:hypothetical protein